MKRRKAYKALGEHLGIENYMRDCHIKHFDDDILDKVILWSKSKIESLMESK